MMYDHINYRLNNTLGGFIERIEHAYYMRSMRRRYRWQERRIRFRRWCAGMHFYRIPETRWTLPISVCLAPSVGIGVSTAVAIVGFRWVRTLSITHINATMTVGGEPATRLRGLPVRRWERSGFFAHRHDTQELW